MVTLHVRVWIEIIRIMCNPNPSPVTLHVRVWIEIVHAVLVGVRYGVTLHVRVWIEISSGGTIRYTGRGHPPREGVD